MHARWPASCRRPRRRSPTAQSSDDCRIRAADLRRRSGGRQLDRAGSRPTGLQSAARASCTARVSGRALPTAAQVDAPPPRPPRRRRRRSTQLRRVPRSAAARERCRDEPGGSAPQAAAAPCWRQERSIARRRPTCSSPMRRPDFEARVARCRCESYGVLKATILDRRLATDAQRPLPRAVRRRDDALAGRDQRALRRRAVGGRARDDRRASRTRSSPGWTQLNEGWHRLQGAATASTTSAAASARPEQFTPLPISKPGANNDLNELFDRYLRRGARSTRSASRGARTTPRTRTSASSTAAASTTCTRTRATRASSATTTASGRTAG